MSSERLVHGSSPGQCRAACMGKSPSRGLAQPETISGTYLVYLVSASTTRSREPTTVQNLSPERQTLQNISVLFRVVVAKPCTVLSAPNSKTALRVLDSGRMEVVFEVLDHTIARIPVDPQESVVIPDTIKALS